MGTVIHFIKARHGDAFVVETLKEEGEQEIVVIDGGVSDTFQKSLKELIKGYSKIDLLILTHTDEDHIGGLISFFKSNLYSKTTIQEYWANCKYSILFGQGSQISFNQAKTFKKFLIKKEAENSETKWDRDIVFTGELWKRNCIEFVVLSPQVEQLEKFYEKWSAFEEQDRSQLSNEYIDQLKKGSIEYLAQQSFNPDSTVEADFANASSIAFIMKCEDISILFLGDARPEVIVDSLEKLGYDQSNNRLNVDYVKISHHGSKNNTSPELLNYINCNNYIISTNGGTARSKHPDRETIARILCRNSKDDNPTNLYFNYKLSDIEAKAGVFLTDSECKEYNCVIYDDVTRIPYEK